MYGEVTWSSGMGGYQFYEIKAPYLMFTHTHNTLCNKTYIYYVLKTGKFHTRTQSKNVQFPQRGDTEWGSVILHQTADYKTPPPTI